MGTGWPVVGVCGDVGDTDVRRGVFPVRENHVARSAYLGRRGPLGEWRWTSSCVTSGSEAWTAAPETHLQGIFLSWVVFIFQAKPAVTSCHLSLSNVPTDQSALVLKVFKSSLADVRLLFDCQRGLHSVHYHCHHGR